MITFKWPYLIMFLPLPILIYYLIKLKNKFLFKGTSDSNQTKNNNGLILPFYDELINTTKFNISNSLVKNSFIISFLKTLIWLFTVLAIMRPIELGKPISLPLPTHDIIMAIDISGSMQSEDMSERYRQTRLDVVKDIAHQFIDKRESDRIGLVFFGSQAFLSSPLTLDQKSLHNFLDKSQIGFAGQKTAIGDALGLAIKRLKSGNKSNNASFIILLSDGSNTSGEVKPLETASIAAKNNIKIYTIGIGKNSTNIFDIQSGMDLDEQTLKTIAKNTNGVYFHATSSSALASIYDEINALEPIASENKVLRPETEWFIYPLLLSFIFSLVLLLT